MIAGQDREVRPVGYVAEDGAVVFYVDFFSFSRKPARGSELYLDPKHYSDLVTMIYATVADIDDEVSAEQMVEQVRWHLRAFYEAYPGVQP